MDNSYVIERHRDALLAIVASLFTLIGLTDGGSIERLSWPIYRKVLAILRPAEAAVRRLIVIAAQGIKVKTRASRPMPKDRVIARKGKGRQSFRLFDPPERFQRRGYRGVVVKTPRPEPRVRLLYDGPLSDGPLIPEFLRR